MPKKKRSTEQTGGAKEAAASKPKPTRKKKGSTVKKVVLCDRERIAQLKERIKENTRAHITNLTFNQCQQLLLQLCTFQPGLIFDVIELSDHTFPPPGPSDPDEDGSPLWCKCGRCRPMPLVEEQLCCKCQPQNCHSILPEMDLLVLHPQVIDVANNYRGEFLLAENDGTMRARRHGAYRQFVLWRHGRLGTGNRVVIPSCVVWRIRDVWPAPNGLYTGFRVSVAS